MKIEDYVIIETRSENIDSCGFCGYKAGKSDGHQRKSKWLKRRYSEGLGFLVARTPDADDVGMIEYTTGEQCWRPVDAPGYLVIHCLMVNGKHKGRGLGSLLLNRCIEDAKKSKRLGVAVVTSSDSFIAENTLFFKMGFGHVQYCPPYELLVRKFRKDSPDPQFIVETQDMLKRYYHGLTILAADQCPMVPRWVEEIAEVAGNMGLEPSIVNINAARSSRELPSGYGMFSIIYNGALVTGRPVSARRFLNIMQKRFDLLI